MIAFKPINLHPLLKIIFFGVAIFASAMLLVPLYFFNPIVHKALLSFSIILISILLLKSEGRSYKSIGIKLKLQSCKYLAVGTLVGVGMLIVTALLTKGIVDFHWQINPAASISGILLLLNFYFWSALVEELWFRGYGFQRLVEYKGKWLALFIVGILFGLYHITSRMPVPEIVGTILTTGFGHVFYGLAVLKTKNLALPLGLHMGWNLAQELMPRHPSLNTESSILHVVLTDGLEYSTASLLIPYLAIIIVGCLIFLFYKDKSFNELNTSKV